MIPAILACPHGQQKAVDALVEHCRKLDGVVPTVIPISKAEDDAYMKRNPGASFPSLQASGLRYCAKRFKGQPFFWMEPDSVPLKPGWLKALTAEYERIKKPFLISSDMHQPFDLVGGIGFYPGETHWLIPDRFERDGWDLWMMRHIPELIGRTPLIQHSYGGYDIRGIVRPRLFPSEASFVRPDTLIFHRDKFLGLTGAVPKTTFLHSGDLGDIIACLPIIRQLGGGKLFITDHKPGLLPAMRPMKNRMHLIEPLLRKVPYLTDVEFTPTPPRVDVNFMDFRKQYKPTRTLTESQAAYIGINQVGMDPWLSVPKSPLSKGRIVCCRSPRYQNPVFPWLKIVNAHKSRILFAGLDEEYAAFTSNFGRVERAVTKNLLELAELIAGSDLFIGNQSSPGWLAMAMGHPIIQESHVSIHDSMAPRRNAQYVVDGRIRLA
jgi:hypothetical protein